MTKLNWNRNSLIIDGYVYIVSMSGTGLECNKICCEIADREIIKLEATSMKSAKIEVESKFLADFLPNDNLGYDKSQMALKNGYRGIRSNLLDI